MLFLVRYQAKEKNKRYCYQKEQLQYGLTLETINTFIQSWAIFGTILFILLAHAVYATAR